MTNHPNRKTRITVDSYGDVTVERDDPFTGERCVTTYFCSGTYVRVRDREGRHPQVCVGLASRGPTLMASRETLPDVIRKELRRAQAVERRELSR